MNDKSASQMIIPTTEDIRSICREVFVEMMQSYTPLPMNVQNEEPVPSTDDSSDIDLGAISETLTGFRKK